MGRREMHIRNITIYIYIAYNYTQTIMSCISAKGRLMAETLSTALSKLSQEQHYFIRIFTNFFLFFVLFPSADCNHFPGSRLHNSSAPFVPTVLAELRARMQKAVRDGEHFGINKDCSFQISTRKTITLSVKYITETAVMLSQICCKILHIAYSISY